MSMDAPNPYVQYGRLLGVYRAVASIGLIATQAAASRLLTLRSTDAKKLVVITRLVLTGVQTGDHTATLLANFRVRRCTGFSVDDNTNATTVTGVALDSSFPTPTAVVTAVTLSGVAAGSTGGTITVVAANFASLNQVMLATLPTAGPNLITLPVVTQSDQPLVLRATEGIAVQNSILFAAAGVANLTVDVTWGEVQQGIV